MTHKKLSLKKGKGGKLKIHKNTDPVEPEIEDEDEIEEEPPFDPDPIEISGKKHPDKSKKCKLAPEGSTYWMHDADGEIIGQFQLVEGEWIEYEDEEEDEEEVDPEDLVEQEMAAAAETPEKGKAGKSAKGKTKIKHTTADDSTETEDEEDIEIVGFPEGQPVAHVGVILSRTINLGQYESVKMSVSISVPSIADEAEIEGNYNFCKDWAETKLGEMSEEYVED